MREDDIDTLLAEVGAALRAHAAQECPCYRGSNDCADCPAIGPARGWLAALVTEVERLTRERDDSNDIAAACGTRHDEMAEKLEQAEAALAEAREHHADYVEHARQSLRERELAIDELKGQLAEARAEVERLDAALGLDVMRLIDAGTLAGPARASDVIVALHQRAEQAEAEVERLRGLLDKVSCEGIDELNELVPLRKRVKALEGIVLRNCDPTDATPEDGRQIQALLDAADREAPHD